MSSRTSTAIDRRARWREQDLPGSGLWYDLGSHLVDQALQLFGVPQTLSSILPVSAKTPSPMTTFMRSWATGR